MLRTNHLFHFASCDVAPEARCLTGTVLTSAEGLPKNLSFLADSCFYFEPVDHSDNLGSIVFGSCSEVYYTSKADPLRSIQSMKPEDFIQIGNIYLSDYCKVDSSTLGTFVHVHNDEDDIFGMHVTPWCSTKIHELVRTRNGPVIDFERFLVTRFFETGIMKKLKAKYHDA